VQNTDILNLPGWQVIACDTHEECYVITALPCCRGTACPACGSLATAKHGTQAQKLHDLPCHGKQVTICFGRPRSRCLACHKTWFEALPEIDEQRRATARLVRYVQKQSLTRIFVSVAAETGLDERSVRNWFQDSVAELERTTPRPTPHVMGVDEIYLLGQPRAVFTDLEARRIVEMLPERKKERIGRYFATLAGKDAISVVVIDMHRPYLDLIQEHIPQAKTVIDKFHVVKLVNEIVDRTRKETHAELTDRQRRTLKRDRYILLKRHYDLTAQQQLLLESWLGQFPKLSAVYWHF
jgi:transposase